MPPAVPVRLSSETGAVKEGQRHHADHEVAVGEVEGGQHPECRYSVTVPSPARSMRLAVAPAMTAPAIRGTEVSRRCLWCARYGTARVVVTMAATAPSTAEPRPVAEPETPGRDWPERGSEGAQSNRSDQLSLDVGLEQQGSANDGTATVPTKIPSAGEEGVIPGRHRGWVVRCRVGGEGSAAFGGEEGSSGRSGGLGRDDCWARVAPRAGRSVALMARAMAMPAVVLDHQLEEEDLGVLPDEDRSVGLLGSPSRIRPSGSSIDPDLGPWPRRWASRPCRGRRVGGHPGHRRLGRGLRQAPHAQPGTSARPLLLAGDDVVGDRREGRFGAPLSRSMSAIWTAWLWWVRTSWQTGPDWCPRGVPGPANR